MKGINKKGISAIVATVLIILITVAAVTIIWAAILPMISDTMEESQRCTSAVAELTLLEDYTCYDSGNDQLKVQIGRGKSEFNLVDIQLLAGTGGATTSFSIKESDGFSDFPGINEERVYTVIGLDAIPDTLVIAPVIGVGQKEYACTASGRTIKVEAC